MPVAKALKILQVSIHIQIIDFDVASRGAGTLRYAQGERRPRRRTQAGDCQPNFPQHATAPNPVGPEAPYELIDLAAIVVSAVKQE